MKLVSVIIPIYNVEKYLKRCVESVRNQTYQKIEIILVDDGSTDRCGMICDEYDEVDNRIKVVHKKNGGLSSARNAGLRCAEGEYIFFLDADDFIDVDTFRILQEKMELHQADIAMCGCVYVDEFGKLKEQKQERASEIVLTGEQLLVQNAMASDWMLISVCNKLYKRAIFDMLLFDEGKQFEDEFIFHNICNRCNLIIIIKEVLYFYTQRSDSITGKGNSARKVDVIEAYIKRILYMNSIAGIQMKIACERTISELYYLIYLYSRKIGSNNLELNRRMKKIRKDVLRFIPIMLKDSSKNIKEKIQLGIWLFSPKIFGRIWDNKKY